MKKSWPIFLVLALLLIVGGCGRHRQPAAANTATNTASVTTSHVADKQLHAQRIIITINNQKLSAHLNHSSAAQALANELPTTLSFRDYPGLPEKVADLGHRLPTNGMPSGHTGTRGSIGYWSPQRRIVFYWGTEEYYEGIHIIGHFDGNQYRTIVKNMGNNVKVKIAKAA